MSIILIINNVENIFAHCTMYNLLGKYVELGFSDAKENTVKLSIQKFSFKMVKHLPFAHSTTISLALYLLIIVYHYSNSKFS